MAPACASSTSDALERLAAVPGVRRVGLSMDQPMAPLEHRAVMIEDRDASASPPVAVYSWITPGYLEALGVPIAAGRGLRATDRRGGEMAVLVNETAARQFWPGEDAVGKRLRGGLDTPWLTVAGVVGDVRDAGLDRAPAPHVYAPLAGVEDEGLGENVAGLVPHARASSWRRLRRPKPWAVCCARRCRPSIRNWR